MHELTLAVSPNVRGRRLVGDLLIPATKVLTELLRLLEGSLIRLCVNTLLSAHMRDDAPRDMKA